MDLASFLRRFPTDDACREQLERAWWPDGPVCHRCGAVGHAGRINGRPGIYTCHQCLAQISVTRGTPLHGSRLPLIKWFEAMFHVAVDPHISAKRLGEKLGVPYSTAWPLHRRIATLINEGRFPLSEYLVLDIGKLGKRPPRQSVNLVPVPDLSCGSGPHENLIIEGDNLLALRWLQRGYHGRVQCILTDPPYGTGNAELAYHDRFSQRDWLHFLRPRLTLARDLLAEDGVLMVCIDDRRRAALDMLLEEIMPGRRVGAMVWRTRSGANDARRRHFSPDHEYVLVYANRKFRFGGVPRATSRYVDDGHPRGPWMSDDLAKNHTRHQRPNTFYPIQDPETGYWYPCNPNAVWRFATEARLDSEGRKRLRKQTMEWYIREKQIIFPTGNRTVRFDTLDDLLGAIDRGDVPTDRRGQPVLTRDLPDLEWWVGRTIAFGRPRFKRFLADLATDRRPLSSWITPVVDGAVENESLHLSSGSTAEGTSLVQGILGQKVFGYAKPLRLFQSLIDQATRPDSIVLDPFAGAGTTAHAVLAANAHDHGHRRFILLSSTEATDEAPEHNQCRDITAERIRRVIERGHGRQRPDPEAGFLYARVIGEAVT